MSDINVCLPDCGENIENFWNDKVDWREDAKWTVYLHTSPSGKYYVGITGQGVNRRWQNGNGYKKNDHFYRAITKYGWNNFQHEIIAKNLTKDEACQMEIKLIAELKSNNHHYGYNLTSGGDYGAQLTKETRQKMSERMKTQWQDPEFRKNMTGKNAPHYGKGTPLKTMRGANNHKSRAVVCLNTGVEYETITKAAQETNVRRASISECCNGKLKFTNSNEDGQKLIWMYKEDYKKLLEEEIRNKTEEINRFIHGSKSIVNITNKEWYTTATYAARVYGLMDSSSITACCNKRQKTAKGCEWMYYSEYLEVSNLTENEAQKSLIFIE